MNKNTILALISCLLFVVGCEQGNDVSKELEAINAELDKMKSELKDEDKIDRNNDGKPDLFIEREGEYIYELYDRNFDGIIDESWEYDLNDELVSGKVDENLDGILETKYISKDYSIDKVFSDSDNNGVFDIYTKLDRGVMVYSEKYYQSAKGAEIGKVTYLYGHPSSPEKIEATDLSEKEFEEARLQ